MKPILAKSRDTPDRFTAFDPATLYEAAGQNGDGRSGDPARLARRKGLRPRDHRGMSAGDNLMLHIAVAQRAGRACVIVANGRQLRVGRRLGRDPHGGGAGARRRRPGHRRRRSRHRRDRRPAVPGVQPRAGDRRRAPRSGPAGSTWPIQFGGAAVARAI